LSYGTNEEEFGVSAAATVLILGEEFEVTPEQPFVFGAFPRRTMRPRTYQQAADLLGPPWTALTVRKQIERLKERAARGDVCFQGPHANYDLADHLVANGLRVLADLARLGRTP
jgi:hypothetical protein